MAINVMTYVWKHSKCKGSDLLALLAIADWCNDYGDCYSGLDRLAQKTRVTVRGFQKIIERLEAQKELLVYPHMGVKTARGKTNAYRIPMEGVNDNLPLTTPILTEKPHDVQPREPKSPKHTPFPKHAKEVDYVNISSSSGDNDHMNISSPADMNISSSSEIDSMNISSSTGVNISSCNTSVDTQELGDTLERNNTPALIITPEAIAATVGLRIVTSSKEAQAERSAEPPILVPPPLSPKEIPLGEVIHILSAPAHIQGSELQSIYKLPITEAYARAIGQPFTPTNAQKLVALRLQVDGYTPDDVFNLTTEKLKIKSDYPFNFVQSDLPTYKRNLTVVPKPADSPAPMKPIPAGAFRPALPKVSGDDNGNTN